jgi:hypothetical protein
MRLFGICNPEQNDIDNAAPTGLHSCVDAIGYNAIPTGLRKSRIPFSHYHRINWTLHYWGPDATDDDSLI